MPLHIPSWLLPPDEPPARDAPQPAAGASSDITEALEAPPSPSSGPHPAASIDTDRLHVHANGSTICASATTALLSVDGVRVSSRLGVARARRLARAGRTCVVGPAPEGPEAPATPPPQCTPALADVESFLLEPNAPPRAHKLLKTLDNFAKSFHGAFMRGPCSTATTTATTTTHAPHDDYDSLTHLASQRATWRRCWGTRPPRRTG